jgi:hypothetical protein
MAMTRRARTALFLAVAAVLVAGITGSQLATAGSKKDAGGGSAPSSRGGGGGVAGACAAPEEGTTPETDCNDTVAGICIAPADGTTAASNCDDTVEGPGDDGRVVDPGDGAQKVEPTPGMADVRPRPFDKAVVSDGGTSVTVFFWSGVEPCYVLDHVDVAYGSGAITIKLFEGHDASAGDVACIEIAVLKKVVVPLDEPAGDRRVVDGAA